MFTVNKIKFIFINKTREMFWELAYNLKLDRASW